MRRMVWISCREAIDSRLMGDVQEYGQDRLPLFGTLSPKTAVLLNLLFLGLLSPYTLKFKNSPLAENLRFPTQRIPQAEADNGGLEYLKDKQTWRKEMPPEIDYWQKFKLFWQAPMTLFFASVLLGPEHLSHQMFDL